MLSKAQDERAKSLGKEISCHKGCVSCCDEVVSVRIQESEAIIYHLYQSDEALSTFMRNFPAWYNRAIQHQDILNTIAKAKNRLLFEGIGSTDKMMETVGAVARSFWDLQIPCPFLNHGSCSIYEIRPIACAVVHSFDPAEYCTHSSNEEPEIQSIYPPSSKMDVSFWDDRLEVIYEDVLPNVVFNTLCSGYGYLSKLPGMSELLREYGQDPEVRRTLAGK